MKKRIHWILTAAFACALLASFYAPGPGPRPDVNGFGRLPVLQNGRTKPIDTVARNSLLMIMGKQSLHMPGRSLSATQWLLELTSDPRRADAYKVFRIDDPDLLGMLGSSPPNQRYHSFNELSPSFERIRVQADQAEKIEARQRSRFQSAVFNLGQRLTLYQRLKNSLKIADAEDFAREVESYEQALGPGLRAVAAHQGSPRSFDTRALARVAGFFSRYRMLSDIAYFKALPPEPGESEDGWLNMGEALLQALREGALRPEVKSYAAMLESYRRSDWAGFNRELAAYQRVVEDRAPGAAAWARYETIFNRVQPFYQGLVIYLAVLLVGFISWLAWPKELDRAAFWLLLLAFAVHTFGLASRILIQGRPPVTNLYSSAVFVGWAAVGLGIILETIHRKGIARVVAAAIGFLTLIVAHHLAASGDTLEMMQAVLDSNFWLGTHVVAITIGYSSTFLAAALGHVYILRGLTSRSMNKATAKSLVQMTYGIVCFSLLFSFVGTILGGIWADQSWGRFWGWDPKENGALMIVLWNAIILHARWGGFIRQRGLMLMAVAGAIFTSLSWFGVNMLGIGLHSYGWTDKAFFWLSAFILAELGVIALGSLPPRYWRSRAALGLADPFFS